MPNAPQQLARRGRDLAFKVATKGYRVARWGAEHALERAFGDGAAEQRERRPGDPPPSPRTFRAPAPPTAAEAVQAEREWRPPDTGGVPPDPTLERVTEEAELVGESSDIGAEGGAGPEVTVAPPWPGYDRMRARDIVDRLAGSDADLAAAVRLYEASTKGRKTVLDASLRAGRV